MSLFNEQIEIIINQRLKLETVRRNLYANFGISIANTKELLKYSNKILKMNSTEKNKFIVELGGRYHFEKTQKYINEDIIRI